MSDERSKFLADTASDIALAVMDSDSGLFTGFDGLGLDDATLQEVQARATDLATKSARRALYSQDEKGLAFERIRKAEAAAKALADGSGQKHLLERAELAERQAHMLRRQLAALVRSSGELPPSANEVNAPEMAMALLNAASIDPQLAQVIRVLKKARENAKAEELAEFSVTADIGASAIEYLDTLHTAASNQLATGHVPKVAAKAPVLAVMAIVAFFSSVGPAHAVVTDPVTAKCPEGTIKEQRFDGFVVDGHGRIKTDDVGQMKIHVDVKCRRILPKFPPNPQPEVYQ